MLSGPVERTGTGSSRYQDLARVAFGARVEHPEGGDGGLGAARCGDVGGRDVPRFPERPARDPRRARRRERDGNPRAYRQPGARLGARGDPFLRAVPGAGATLADEEIWRGHVRAGRAPMSTPSGILKRISASLIASYSSSCCPILPSLRRPVRLLSPDPRTPVREIAGKRFWVARVRGSVIHDPATRSERAGVSRDGRHVGRAIASRSTLRARRRVSAGLSVEPGGASVASDEGGRQKTMLSGQTCLVGCKRTVRNWAFADLAGGTVGGAIGATGAFRTERPWRDLSCGCPTGR